jgi:hypothetical protein
MRFQDFSESLPESMWHLLDITFRLVTINVPLLLTEDLASPCIAGGLFVPVTFTL